MENLDNNYLNNQYNQYQPDEEDLIQTSDEKQNQILFNEIIDDLIRKKTNKENEIKNQIEKNKKNLLEKFYSLSNTSELINNTININNNNSQNQNNIEENNNNIQNNNIKTNAEQLNQKEKENINILNNNTITKNNNIPNNINPNLIPDGQKEYDEIREKYKNERNKKKSSIFKSEDLRISNTNSVHLKKEDFSPINPNIVNQENKNNILIIQKKLFGDSDVNEETSKVENIDEIDDLEFDDLNIKDFKNDENSNINNKNMGKTSTSNVNLTNLDTNNINFDLSSNFKSEINENENNNFFPNEILVRERAVEYCYFGTNTKDINNKNDKFKDYKKIINRTKNFSVQLVSKLDYYIEDENKNNNFRNKKRKGGSNQEVMNEMNNFIKNLIPQNMNNNIGNKFNGNEFNYEFDKINNNININNSNNNININDTNLAKIISQQQQQLKQKKNININNTKKNNNINSNINNSQKNTSENYLNNNYNININKNIALLSKNNSHNKNTNIKNLNINKNSNTKANNIINRIDKQIHKENKTKNQPNYKKIIIAQKPSLNNLDININQNIQKANTKIKMNYRHISNSNIQKMIKNNTNINTNNTNNQSLNNIKHKRKNNSVIIKREISKEKNDKNKEIYLWSNNINNNKTKDQKKMYHFNTNNNYNYDLRSNYNSNNLKELNSLKNNIKNMIGQIPSFNKSPINPLTTKNKKVSMTKIIKNKLNINNLDNSNGNNSTNNINNNGINYNSNSNSNSNHNTDSNKNKSKNRKKNNNNINLTTGNKFAILNTIHKNNLIKYTRLTQQIEAINKLKQHSYLGVYFIYVEKVNEGFLFKGIYKRGPSEVNPICNKIYGVPNTPLMLSYEKFLLLAENNKKEFIPIKLSTINVINYSNTILLVRND